MGFQSTTCFFFSRATTLPSASTTSRRTKPLISGSARLLVRWREASAPRPTSYRGAMFSLWSSQRRATISTPSSKGSSIRRRNWRPYVVTDSENRRKEEARPHSKKPRFFPLPPGLCSGSPRTIFVCLFFCFSNFQIFPVALKKLLDRCIRQLLPELQWLFTVRLPNLKFRPTSCSSVCCF